VRPNYNNKPRPAQLPAQSNQRPGNRKPFLDKCQWCNVRGHVLSQCRTFRQQHPGIPPPPRDLPQVNTATVGPPQTDFLVDSGATHHITNDLANMAIHHPYTGPDSLFMGNSSGLNWRWEKPQEGGVELCFWKLLLLRSEDLFSGSESEVVQSLSEFRVYVQQINVKNRRRKNTSNYTGSFHKPEVVLSALHFQGEFH